MTLLQITRLTLAVTVLGSFSASVFAEDGDANEEARYLTKVRQLTFEGKRAGEGYFSAGGTRMVFQSERLAENPFYQIFLMDLTTGDQQQVSPGHGKTTCAWIHPTDNKVVYASTQADPEAVDKQKAEIDFRASGQTRRYSWDYDEQYDLFEADLDTGNYKRLTTELGYDAEGSYSPDGKRIAFGSNRHAYAGNLNTKEQELLDRDQSYFMEIYIMNADGSGVKRLTNVAGYDGGPFFSPDGKRIVWRRFSEAGDTAEVYSMKIDGSDVQQLTSVNAMSWAPYYHPSGDYIIFTNNTQGFGNFELHMIDAAGQKDPVRVTFTDGFDGLPVFTPDGNGLSWTSNRTTGGVSQIFMAEWSDAAARAALGIDGAGEPDVTAAIDAPDLSTTNGEIRAADIRQHITYLASDELEGRRTGTRGGELATEYVASIFEELGLAPAGDENTFFQPYEFTAGVSLDKGNVLRVISGSENQDYEVDEDWRPVSFSGTGTFDPAGVVFAGYGIVAPEVDDGDSKKEGYDSYVHLDVEGKWVLAFRFIPEDVEPNVRQHLNSHSAMRRKAKEARDRGAAGLLLVTGPNAAMPNELASFTFDNTPGISMPVLSVSDDMAEALLAHSDKDLKTLQTELDTGGIVMGFDLPDTTVESVVRVKHERRTGRNVIARLVAGEKTSEQFVAIGAHLDHLGKGQSNFSLARSTDENTIHYGADDNASGVAGMIEIAQSLLAQQAIGTIELKRDVVFCAWTGEEMGLLGVTHFANELAGENQPLSPTVFAYLNMDMIGRMTDKVIIQGVGSSSIWPGEIERRNVPVGLNIVTQDDPYLPTDAREFYVRGVPFLNAFTGAHVDYHTPRDTADKVNYEGTEQITKFMALLARSLVTRDEAPDYQEMEKPEGMGRSAVLRAYLGTIPDYTGDDIVGTKLGGVTKGAPADKAGLKSGDIIIELAGTKIENVYDYTFAIEGLKVGEAVPVVVMRGDERVELSITPGTRE
jgi:Tol biopolymer transport system component